jgi:hypothetical protein
MPTMRTKRRKKTTANASKMLEVMYFGPVCPTHQIKKVRGFLNSAIDKEKSEINELAAYAVGSRGSGGTLQVDRGGRLNAVERQRRANLVR